MRAWQLLVGYFILKFFVSIDEGLDAAARNMYFTRCIKGRCPNEFCPATDLFRNPENAPRSNECYYSNKQKKFVYNLRVVLKWTRSVVKIHTILFCVAGSFSLLSSVPIPASSLLLGRLAPSALRWSWSQSA